MELRPRRECARSPADSPAWAPGRTPSAGRSPREAPARRPPPAACGHDVSAYRRLVVVQPFHHFGHGEKGAEDDDLIILACDGFCGREGLGRRIEHACLTGKMLFQIRRG